MALPRLLQRFAAPACFTLSEASLALGKDRSATLEDVKYLKQEGYVETVRRGLYAFDPEKTGQVADRYVLASKLATPYVLSYHSALDLLGVAQSAFYNVVYVGTPERLRPFEYRESRFEPVATPPSLLELGVEEMKRSGETVRVAGRELALVQCADRLKYAGGFEELVQNLDGFPSLRWDLLSRLLQNFGKVALYRKVGFLVEMNRGRWHPPPEFLEDLAGHAGKGATYFGVGSNQRGRWLPRWHVIVPERWKEVAAVG